MLPDRFKKIRHAGLYAGASVNKKLAKAFGHCAPVSTQTAEPSACVPLTSIVGQSVVRCPLCGAELVAVFATPVETLRRDTS